MQDIELNATKRERSPGTLRKLSYRASEYALIQYLSTLPKNRSAIKSFDFAFVEYLLEDGADINYRDKTGQSAFHIVAKFWNTDVARFLLDQGANINAQDCLGRSPLHDAAALNCVDMVEFLLNNGADLNIKTFNQEQTPIHFAAKNDSCQTLSILLAHGADINSLDSKKRTPLQVAAGMNRAKVAELLINEGASAAIYDADGNSALTLLTEKLPEVALMALNQLHSIDNVNRREYFSLNNLDGWTIEKSEEAAAPTPLEIAVQARRFSMVMHPVLQRLVKVKWDNYGKWGAITDLMLNLFYVVLWSVMSIVLSCKSDEIYLPLDSKGWRLAIVIVIVIITGEEIRKQIADTLRVRRQRKDWIEWRARALEEDMAYCDSQYVDEWTYLSEEVKSVRNQSYLSTGDGWIYVDWLALLLIIATIATHIVFLKLDSLLAYKIHSGVLIGLLLILWIRIAKYARPFQSTGPIVVIFAHIMKDIVKCAFLFVILFIPYACAFWLTYGANSPKPVKGYSNLPDLLYNMLCMVVGIDFPFDDLLLEDAFMARTLCSTFIISTAIVVVNLLIALLSDTFTRLYSNAVANAIMQRAQSILALERKLGKQKKKDYYKYLRDHCSPQIISMDHESVSKKKTEKSSNKDKLVHEIKQINIALRRLEAKSFSSMQKQSDGGKSVHAKSTSYSVGQLLKQSQENTIKISKLYEIMMKWHKPEEKLPQPCPQHSLVLSRKCSVFSAASLDSAVVESYEMMPTVFRKSMAIPFKTIDQKEGTIPETDENKRKSISSKEGDTSLENNNLKEATVSQQDKHAVLHSIGEENKGFENSEIFDSQPCGSEVCSHQGHSQRGLTLRRNSTISVPPDCTQALPRTQRYFHLDDGKYSSDESVSL